MPAATYTSNSHLLQDLCELRLTVADRPGRNDKLGAVPYTHIELARGGISLIGPTVLVVGTLVALVSLAADSGLFCAIPPRR